MSVVTEKDRDRAREVLHALGSSARITTDDGTVLDLPKSVLEALAEFLEAAANGERALVLGSPEDLTTSRFGVTTRGDAKTFLGALLVGLAFDVAAHSGLATVAALMFTIAVAGCLLASGRLRSPASRGLVALAPVVALAFPLRSSPWVLAPALLAVALLLAVGVSFARERPLRSTFPVLAGRLATVAGHVTLAPGMLRANVGATTTATKEPAATTAATETAATATATDATAKSAATAATETAAKETTAKGTATAMGSASPTRTNGAAAARGLALAAPVVLLVGALLTSADPVFRAWFDVPAMVRNLALVAVGAWVLLGLCRAASADTPAPVGSGRLPSLGAVEVVSVLGALCALYAAFVAAQVVALMGGEDHVLSTTGLTYAEYARSGFFQLLAAAAVTLVVILGVRSFADRTRTSVVVVSEATVALTLGVVVVAIRRLALYEDAYGLTMLRLASAVTAVWIGLVFVLLAVAVARPRTPGGWFAPVTVLSGVLFVALWAAADPAALVARTNVERAADGSELDIAQAVGLGPDAVPALVAGLDQLGLLERAALRDALCLEHADDHHHDGGLASNRSEGRAAAALDEACPSGGEV